MIGSARKTISISASLVLDPLFSASGFLAHYICRDEPCRRRSFSIFVFNAEETPIFELALEREGKSAEEVYIFVERVAGFLEGHSGIPHSDVRLWREIGLFEEALFLSQELIRAIDDTYVNDGEDFLKSLWSLPTGALVLALSGGSLFRERGILRFSADFNVSRELNRLIQAIHSLKMKGPLFAVPPLCYMGEIVRYYMDSSMVDGKGGEKTI